MKKLKISILVIIFGLGIYTNVSAQELSGKQIIEKVYNRPTGDDQTSDLTMTLINKSGNQRVRKIKQFTKDLGEVEKILDNNNDNVISFMDWPAPNPGVLTSISNPSGYINLEGIGGITKPLNLNPLCNAHTKLS